MAATMATTMTTTGVGWSGCEWEGETRGGAGAEAVENEAGSNALRWSTNSHALPSYYLTIPSHTSHIPPPLSRPRLLSPAPWFASSSTTSRSSSRRLTSSTYVPFFPLVFIPVLTESLSGSKMPTSVKLKSCAGTTSRTGRTTTGLSVPAPRTHVRSLTPL